MKYLIIMIFSMFSLSCSPTYKPKELVAINLHLGDSTYKELVDFLYDFSSENRLTVSWFGWYKVSDPKKWYERSNESSNFKIKLVLLSQENGSLFFSDYFDKNIASLFIDYGDKNPEWMAVIKDFEKAVENNNWNLEYIKKIKNK